MLKNDHYLSQLYHREDARSNSLPPEVLHSSVYQPPLRERFNSLDSNYCSGAEHRAGLHRVGEITHILWHGRGEYSLLIGWRGLFLDDNTPLM